MRQNRQEQFGGFLDDLEARYSGGGGSSSSSSSSKGKGKGKGKKREGDYDDISDEAFEKAQAAVMGKKTKGK